MKCCGSLPLKFQPGFLTEHCIVYSPNLSTYEAPMHKDLQQNSIALLLQLDNNTLKLARFECEKWLLINQGRCTSSREKVVMKDYKPKIKVSSLLRLQKFLSIYHVTSGKEEGACLRNLNLSWPPPRFALIQWKIARMKIFDIQIPMSGNLKCLMIIRMCRLLK